MAGEHIKYICDYTGILLCMWCDSDIETPWFIKYFLNRAGLLGLGAYECFKQVINSWLKAVYQPVVMLIYE